MIAQSSACQIEPFKDKVASGRNTKAIKEDPSQGRVADAKLTCKLARIDWPTFELAQKLLDAAHDGCA